MSRLTFIEIETITCSKKGRGWGRGRGSREGSGGVGDFEDLGNLEDLRGSGKVWERWAVAYEEVPTRAYKVIHFDRL